MSANMDIEDLRKEIQLLRQENNRLRESLGDIPGLVEAARKARESEELLRQMANTVPCAIYHCAHTANWEIYFISDQIERISGYSPSEFSDAMDYIDIVHEDDRDDVHKAVDEGIARDGNWLVRYRIVRRDGNIRYVHEEGRAIENDGKITLFGFVLDITESMEMEKSLRRFESQARMMMNASTAYIALLDSDRRVIISNEHFENVAEIDPSTMRAINIDNKREAALRSEVFERVSRLESNSISFCPLEDVRAFEVHLHSMGNDGRVAVFAVDISHFRDALREIEYQKEYWYNLLDRANVWIEVLDENANLIFLNRKAVEISGWEPINSYGNKRHWELFYPDRQYREKLIDVYFKKMRKQEQVKDYRTVIETKDKGQRTLSWSVTFTKDRNGKLTGSLLVANDITEQLELEKERDQSERRFRLLAENSPDYIAIYDPTADTIIYANRDEFLGWTSGDIPDKKQFFKYIHPDDMYLLVSRMGGLSRLDKRLEIEFRGRHKKGNWEWLEMRISPLPDMEGQKNVMLTVSVITERKESQKRIEQSEKRLSLLLEASKDVIAIFDREGRYTYHKGPEKYRIKTEDLLNKTPVEYIDCEDSHRRYRQIMRVIEEGVTLNFENRWVFDDEEIWFHDELNPVYDERGNVKAVVSIGRNITDIKKAQKELIKKNSFLKMLMDNLPAMIFVKDLKGRFLMANQAFADFTGRDIEELLGRHDFEVFPREIMESFEGRDEKTIAEKYLHTYVDEMAIQGRRITLITRKLYLSETGLGEPGILGISTDISQLSETKSKLADEKKRLASVLASLDEGVILVDPEGYIAYMNQRASHLTGLPEERALKRPLEKVLRLSKSGKGINDGEFILTGRESVKHCVLLTTERIETHEGVAKVIVIRDITDERSDKERIERLERMEALGRLASGVAHDLNNLLSGLVNYPELILLDLPEEHPSVEYVKAIKDYGLSASRTVRNLLTMARSGSVEKSCLDLRKEMETILDLPTFSGLKERFPNLRITRDLCGKELPIVGNSSQIEMSLMNLINNAAEAGANLISISSGLKYLEKEYKGYDNIAPGTYAVIGINDNGEGIKPDDLPHVFEPFYSSKQKDMRKGTGLGLALVWGTVKDHGGYIDLVSEPGYTSFNIYLPLTEQEQCERASTIQDTARILVIDDMASQLEIAKRFLGREGYEVETAQNSREAMKKAAESKFDLVLLDMQLGEKNDGLDVFMNLRRLRGDQRVLFVTGNPDNSRLLKALDLGADGYITKPYFLRELLGMIEDICS